MTVIINEFEADLEPPRKRDPEPGADAAPEGKDSAPSLSPMDMEDVLRQRLERLARIMAD